MLVTSSRPRFVVAAFLAAAAVEAACSSPPAVRQQRAAVAPPPPVRSPAAPQAYRGPAAYRPPAPGMPARDVTRDPLTQTMPVGTPPAEAAALRLGDRARNELERGTTERAIELLDTAIQSSPNTVQLYVIRAHVLLIEGSNEQARADLERAVALEPNAAWLAEAVAVNGELHEARGNRDAALASYRRALSIFPANQTARTGLSRLAAR